MTDYLQRRFKQKKIYLMGHSWGSYLGIKIAGKYPENYLAFIGIGQISNQVESERLAYDYMMKLSTEKNDNDVLEKLKQFDKNAPDFPGDDYLMPSRGIMNKYGIGMAHQNISMSKIVMNVMLFKGYTFYEKINYTKGSLFSQKLFDNVINDNLFESSTSFEVPVYIIHGKHDYVTSYVLAREYSDLIEAPSKAFFTFENSAHSPNLEEPEKFVLTVREIIKIE